jgi:DNA-binding NtrC family response regulator
MSLRLLIVEDDIALQKMLTWDFVDLGYTVIGVTNCRQAREQAAGNDFDLALIDYHLPDGTGVDLLKDLRARRPEMPIIMCSGLTCAETASRAVTDHGAFEFVAKPVGARTLHQIFQTALSKREKTRNPVG